MGREYLFIFQGKLIVFFLHNYTDWSCRSTQGWSQATQGKEEPCQEGSRYQEERWCCQEISWSLFFSFFLCGVYHVVFQICVLYFLALSLFPDFIFLSKNTLSTKKNNNERTSTHFIMLFCCFIIFLL